MLVTDSASYSDIVFGLFMMLGYRFCRINTNLIAQNWDDLVRMVGSLKLGMVSAHELIQTFQGTRRHSSVARALAEYSRIGQTLHLLDQVDDEV